jgi:putative flippase GtrA
MHNAVSPYSKALNLAVLWLGLTVLGWPVALAQATAMVVYTVCFFVGCKVLVFWRP